MSVIRDLAEGALYLLPVGLGAGLVYAYGRDRTAANEHDLWAPHDEPTAVEPGPAIVWNDQAAKERHDQRAARDEAEQAAYRAANAALTGPVGLAACEPTSNLGDPATVPWNPPYADLAIAQVMRRHGDDAEDIARRWLRAIGAEQQAKAGIRPVLSPATDRDLTGAFAVVAVA